jgi:hypothetical protein
MVQADGIRWTAPPIARLEDVDPLRFDGLALLEYIADLQHEARALRALAHRAVHTIAGLTDDLKARDRVIEFQRQQLRRQRGAA